MADKDKFVNIADLKAKLRYWCKSRSASKTVQESLMETIKRIPYTIRAEISETLEIGSGWIPCSERLPEDFVWCLVCMSDGCVRIGKWNGEYDEQGVWCVSHPNCGWKLYRIKNVPFWMPLPEPPDENGRR